MSRLLPVAAWAWVAAAGAAYLWQFRAMAGAVLAAMGWSGP